MTVMTLTPVAGGSPAPFVQVDSGTLPASAATLTAWRTVKGRQSRVRGMVDVVADGSSVQDFEAPFDVELSYRFQYFDAAGNFVGWSDPSTTTLDGPDGPFAWIHNVLDPSTSLLVGLLQGSAPSIVRPTNAANTLQVLDKSVGFSMPGTRGGVTSVLLNCHTSTFDDADQFDLMFGGYDDPTVPILCFRVPVAMRLPLPFIALVASPSQVPINNMISREDIRWELAADETAPPAEALVVALLSYADFTAFYADYAAFTSAYADYTGASRDYSIAGTA